MANPPSSSGIHLQTLNPGLVIFSRRRHLDSASYRTLVRIFSHCLDLSLNSSQEPSKDPLPELDSSSPRLEVPEISLTPEDGSTGGGSESKKGDSVLEVPCDGNLALDEVLCDGFGLNDACVSDDRLNDLVSDLSALIDAQNGVLCADNGLQDVQIENSKASCDTSQKDAKEQVSIWTDGLNGGNKSVSNLFAESHKRKCIELGASPSEMLFSAEIMQLRVEEGNAGSVNSVIVQDTLHEEPATVHLENANSKAMDGLKERVQEESNCCLNPIADVSESGNLTREVDMVVSLVDNEEIEEGEIPDDAQQLEECSDTDNVDETLKDQKTKEDFIESVHLFDADGISVPQNKRNDSSGFITQVSWPTAFPDAASLPTESYDKAASENKGQPPGNEAPNAEKKRKRVPTDERKAKRKKSKRIKRAQKEREQGVKRLKLQPVVKPKVVKYCNFYLMGRCQQGDLCKFSHDTTPLTKSTPCKHLACGSCLKGDDCPFDHQLSKYPCHNFLSKGMCIRGDNCKFSHNIAATDASSMMSGVKKLDTPLLEKLQSRKQTYLQNTSALPNDVPKTTASAAHSCSSKHLKGSMMKSIKAPMGIPKGIRFLSLGREQSDSSSRHQDNLLVETDGSVKVGTQTNQGRFPVEGDKNAENSCQRRLPTDHEPNMTLRGASNSQNKKIVSEPCSGSKSLQTEVSEASKILEEFLFCATS